MTLTRSVLLTVALAIALSPACKDRSTEHQAIARPEQTPLPTAEVHATATERIPPATATARVPLATGPRLPAAPTLDNGETATPHGGQAASPTSRVSARAPAAIPQARQLAPTEADIRQVIYQVQARMDGELARAHGVIVELQKANAELQQTLAAERAQLVDLRKRLMSGRSIALQ